MMRKIYFVLLATLLFCRCYDDKGNYDYTTQEAFEISLNETYFERQIGGMLSIQPTIETKIPDSDLSYQWEVHSLKPGDSYTVFNKFAEGKNLDWECLSTELMPSIGQYIIRLHATQISTQRNFYSEQITLSIAGITGLLVLHGDDSQSDIGLLVAPEFRGSEVTDETIASYPTMYSQANGAKIQGKGKAIYHLFTSYMLSRGLEDQCYVVALTDQEVTLANYAGLQKSADYLDLFYSASVPHGKPQSFYVYDSYEAIIDDGVLFFRKPYNTPLYVAPEDNEVQASLAEFENGIYFSPFVLRGKNGATYTRMIMFNTIDQGFVGYTDGSMWPNRYAKLDATLDGTTVPFNPAKMNADLLYMDHGGSTDHTMAVMQEAGGKKYIVEMDLKTRTLSQMPYAKYDDISGLQDFNSAFSYAFGEDQFHMCYYATSNAVYRYSVEKGRAPQGEKLMTVDGQVIDFNGAEITMMCLLKPSATRSPSWSYKYYNQMLLVGTYANGEGILRAFIVDQSSGRVISETSYSGFDRIRAAAIKGV